MTFRVIARLDIKPPNLVKGIHLEGLRKIGDPWEYAKKYYAMGADEISYQDIVASLYNRNSIAELVAKTTSEVFIPISVGGGIRKPEDARNLVRMGADKIVLNTAAVSSPSIIRNIAEDLGKQAVVLGVEAMHQDSGSWEVMTNGGREHTGKKVIEWIREAEQLGVGEILLTSINKEGTRKGFDLRLIESARKISQLPLIAHGGGGCLKDIVDVARTGADAVALASVLHYGILEILEIKKSLRESDIEVRL